MVSNENTELFLDVQESVKRFIEELFDIWPNTHIPIGNMVVETK